MRPLLLAVVLVLASPLVAPDAGRAQSEPDDPEVQAVTRLVAAGWAFLDAGSLVKAEAAFTEAFELRAGKDRAQVYYGLAAIWWERRNAMAAYSWLSEAEAAKKNSWYWNGGDDGSWDRRIHGRRRYIERNFTVVKFRYPGSGRPLPPLVDPIPADPLLRSFTDALARQVREGADAGAGVQWFFLPNTTYLVGGSIEELGGGELEPIRASSWNLPADRGSARRKYDDTVTAQQQAQMAAEAVATEQAAARQRAWEADQAGSSPGGAVATNTPTTRGGGDASEPTRARPLEADPDQRPLAHRLVTFDTVQRVSDDITERWRSGGFHARYGLTCPNSEAQHEIDFVDADFYVRFDQGGELKVRGAERLTEKLRADFLCGNQGEVNLIELWYDGRKLLVVVNGVEFGPVTVRKGDPGDLVGRWDITLSDFRAELQHLWIEPWSGS